MFFVIANFAFAQELLTNEGFENWTVNGASGPPDDWNLSGTSITAAQEATEIHGGTYSVNLTWTTTSTRYLRQQDVAVTEGTNYLFTYWALDNDPDGRCRVTVRWYDSGGGFISGYYGDYSSDSPDWQQMTSGLQAAPTGAVTADVEIRVYDVSGWDGEATVYVDDASFTASTTVEISKAYSISDSEIDVIYTNDVAAVDPADYTLTGTATITFSGATIDALDATVVHLTGASATIDGDRTLDNIDDSANGTNYDFYAGIMPIMYTNTSIPGGTVDDTHFATYTGIISANDEYNNVWIHDNFGAYNGVMIYDSGFDNLVDVGDEILVFAKRSPYYSLTELVDPELISTISTGNTPYGPTVINGSDIDEDLVADENPGEIYEGQLCKIEDFTVVSYTDYDYRCSWVSPSFRDTFYFHVGDNVDYHFGVISLNVGSEYSEIVGIIDWYNSDENYRINPRDDSDYIISGDYDPPTITSAAAPDENTVEVYFNEDVEETTAETTGNYSIVARDVTVTDAVLDVGDATHVTLTVTGMTEGNYTLTATGVEDLSGNPSNDSEDFSYIAPLPDGAIVINEIMYNSPGTDNEWIELHNTTGAAIDLENFYVLDDDNGHDHLVIPAGHSIAAGGYFTIAIAIGSPPLGFTPDYDGSGDVTWALNNGGDEVRLFDTADRLVDNVPYDDGGDWPTAPDGDGPSLELIDPAYDNTLGTSWQASSENGGTPGAENSDGQDITPPTIEDVIATDSTTVVVTFNEDVEETTAETTTNYTITARDVTVTAAVRDESDNSEVTLTVTGMTEGNYTLAAVGVEDLAGNPSDDSENFSYSEGLADIVINEIHYNPSGDLQGDDQYYEFLELYNNDAITVDLTDYSFDQGITFTFPGGSSIDPGEYIIVAYEDTTYDGNGYQVFEWSSGGLSNGGEDIDLRDAGNNQIDYVDYDDYTPWPTEPDGDGPSLELNGPSLDNTLAENWHASAATGGSPGAANSAPTPDPPQNITISQDGTNVTISWDVEAGVTYTIYSDSDPYGSFATEEETGNTSGTYTETLDTKKFFRVTANN